MILSLTLNRLHEQMASGVVDKVHMTAGSALPMGAKLLDLKVDLSGAQAHDCPPVTYYRLVLRDRAWLRDLKVSVGDTVPAGSLIALFTTTPDEALDLPAEREIRTSVAAIIPPMGWDLTSA